MTLPAYVLQLLTNATEPALPVSWQAGSGLLPAASGAVNGLDARVPSGGSYLTGKEIDDGHA